MKRALFVWLFAGGWVATLPLAASTVTFTLNSSQSELTFSGSVDPSNNQGSQTIILPRANFRAQSGFSLDTGYSGTITVDLSDGIRIVSANVTANNQGSAYPGPGGINGTASADYAVESNPQYTSPATFRVLMALRDIGFDMESSVLSPANGNFSAGDVTLFTQGFMALRNSQPEPFGNSGQSSDDLTTGNTGQLSNDAGGNGNVTVTPGSATLSLPVSFPYDETDDDGNNLEFTLAGSFTATATLTEAPADPVFYANYHGLTGTDAEPDQDPDGDGQDNRVEAALGSDPDDPSSKGQFYIVFFDDNGTDAVGLTFPVRAGGAMNGTDYEAGSFTYQARTGSTPSAVSSTMTEVVPAQTTGLPPLPSGYVYKTFSPGSFPNRAFFNVTVP